MEVGPAGSTPRAHVRVTPGNNSPEKDVVRINPQQALTLQAEKLADTVLVQTQNDTPQTYRSSSVDSEFRPDQHLDPRFFQLEQHLHHDALNPENIDPNLQAMDALGPIGPPKSTASSSIYGNEEEDPNEFGRHSPVSAFGVPPVPIHQANPNNPRLTAMIENTSKRIKEISNFIAKHPGHEKETDYNNALNRLKVRLEDLNQIMDLLNTNKQWTIVRVFGWGNGATRYKNESGKEIQQSEYHAIEIKTPDNQHLKINLRSNIEITRQNPYILEKIPDKYKNKILNKGESREKDAINQLSFMGPVTNENTTHGTTTFLGVTTVPLEDATGNPASPTKLGAIRLKKGSEHDDTSEASTAVHEGTEGRKLETISTSIITRHKRLLDTLGISKVETHNLNIDRSEMMKNHSEFITWLTNYLISPIEHILKLTSDKKEQEIFTTQIHKTLLSLLNDAITHKKYLMEFCKKQSTSVKEPPPPEYSDASYMSMYAFLLHPEGFSNQSPSHTADQILMGWA